MKHKKGFELRDVCGETVVIATGIENIDFTSLVRLNESAAYLWKAVEGKTFSVEDLADLLCQAYETSRETTLNDAQCLAEEWKKFGIIEE